jgi:hypothetical protein
LRDGAGGGGPPGLGGGGRSRLLTVISSLSRDHAVEPGCFDGGRELKLTFSGTSPHFSHPFYRGLFFPVVAAFRLLTPRAGCSHTALRPSRRTPCHTGKFPRLVTKRVRNAGQVASRGGRGTMMIRGLKPTAAFMRSRRDPGQDADPLWPFAPQGRNRRRLLFHRMVTAQSSLRRRKWDEPDKARNLRKRPSQGAAPLLSASHAA